MGPAEHSYILHPGIKAPILSFGPREYKKSSKLSSASIRFPWSSRKVAGTMTKESKEDLRCTQSSTSHKQDYI